MLAVLFFVSFTTETLGAKPLDVPSLAIISPGAPGVVLPEIDDFATTVMGDPWDMNESTDLAFYRKESQMVNSTFSNGIYSAQTTAGQGGERITLLTAGSQGGVALRQGKTGYMFPINADYYRYLTFRMCTSNTSPAGGLIQWFADDSYSNAVMGVSNSFSVPAKGTCSSQPSDWSIYTLDLKTIGIQLGSQNWTGTIRELLIHPVAGTGAAGATVKLDWARLTAADPRTARPYTIQWTGNGSGGAVTLYANPDSPTLNANSIVIATGLNASGGSYVFQTGVLPAGSYYVGASNGNGTAWSSGPLIINTPPIPTILKPSMTSGQDYAATVNGLPWDMNDTRDVNYNLPPNLPTCLTNQIFSNGIYSALVPSPVCPPGSGWSDPIMYLGGMDRNPPGVLDPIVDTSKFRYLSYRFNQAGTQDVQNGWVSRFGWWQVNANKSGINEPPVLTRDLIILEGWNTYKIDLWDPSIADPMYNQAYTWTKAHPNRLRFDPDELTAPLLPGSVQMDWIKLTAMDQVVRGVPFPIQLSLNKPPQTIRSLTFYYTTSRQQPTQNQAVAYSSTPPPPGGGSFYLYLPIVVSGYDPQQPPPPNGVVFNWDTAPVGTGTYFICVLADDSYNQTTYCSEAPVIVQ